MFGIPGYLDVDDDDDDSDAVKVYVDDYAAQKPPVVELPIKPFVVFETGAKPPRRRRLSTRELMRARSKDALGR